MKLVSKKFVLSITIEPVSQVDEERIERGLSALESEGHSFSFNTDKGTRITTLRGSDELHLDTLITRLLEDFNVQARIGAPCVVYLEAGGKRLEPIMKIELVTPKEKANQVKNDLRSRRGRILDQVDEDASAEIGAFVPMVNMFGFVNNFRSMTGGRGTFAMCFDHYAPPPIGIGPDDDPPFSAAKRA